MATQTEEELQAKEFLKRAEIRTMRKDLTALRESDALKERDRIVRLKPEEKNYIPKKTIVVTENSGLENVLQRNEQIEKEAEKDIKNYATEEELQQIFLLESQRFSLEKEIDIIDKEKDPVFKLDENKLLLQRRDQEAKLKTIVDQEKRAEEEQKLITEKSQTTNIPSERKGLEQRRWEMDKQIQDIEKKRWEVEKQIQEINNQIGQRGAASEKLVAEKNGLRDRVLGTDKSLRDIYSNIMARVEEERAGKAAGQISTRENLERVRSGQKEKVQRQQWSVIATEKHENDMAAFSKTPVPRKARIVRPYEKELEERKRFLREVEILSQDENQPTIEPQIATPASKPLVPPRKQ